MRPATRAARFTKARNGIALLLASIASFLFLSQFLEWRSSAPMLASQIISVVEQPRRYRQGTHRRFEAEVRHSGQSFTGFFESYWYTGRPSPGEVLDLRRADHGGYLRFHFDHWTREFSAWFVVLLLVALLAPAYLALFRSLERFHQRSSSRR